MSQPLSANDKRVSDNDKIQRLEEENKRLRAAVGEKDDGNAVKRKIAELKREIEGHKEILSRLESELAALQTGRHAVKKSVETSDREAMERWQKEHKQKLSSSRYGYLS